MSALENQILFDLLAELIECRAITGAEALAQNKFSAAVTKFLPDINICKIPTGIADRESILFFGTKPKILLTTHIDVVPASDEMFKPRITNETIFGRGSLDAQGILISMLGAFYDLIQKNSEVGLLVVVGEEVNGIGARTSASYLKDWGIRYLINGEPTDSKIARGHKGMIEFSMRFFGVNAHSGYPELGVDANAKMISAINEVLKIPLPSNDIFGKTTINIGKISAGSAANIVSAFAEAHCTIRLTENIGPELQSQLKKICSDQDGELIVQLNYPPVNLNVLDGFEETVVSYGTDVPNFLELNSSLKADEPKCEFILFGPGSIFRAHTDKEFILKAEIVKARSAYESLVHKLESKLQS